MNYKKAKVAILGLFLSVSFFASTDVVANKKTEEEVKAVRDNYVTITLSTDKISLLLEKNDLVTDSANVNVRTSNYSGYTLSFNIKNDYNALKNLQGETGEIPAIAETATASSFPTLGWGYSFDEESDKNFYTAPLENTTIASSSTTGAQDYPLTVGARVDGSLPQGSYGNTFTFTAIANPLTIAVCNPSAINIYEAVCMQDMNDDVINTMMHNTTYYLVDARDQKKYAITYDGHEVYMLQNLDLDITNGMTLTSDLTDLNSKSSWTPNVTRVDDYYSIMGTETSRNAAIEAEKLSADKAVMYELGDYYYVGGQHVFNYADNEAHLFEKDPDVYSGKIISVHDDKDLHECYYYDYSSEGEYYDPASYDYYSCDTEIVPTVVENPLDFGSYFTTDPTINPTGHIGNLYSTAAIFAADTVEEIAHAEKQYLGDNDYDYAADSICPKGWSPRVGDSMTHPIYSVYTIAMTEQEVWNNNLGQYVYEDYAISYTPFPNSAGYYQDKIYASTRTPLQSAVTCGIPVNSYRIYYYDTYYDYIAEDYKISSGNDAIYMTVLDVVPEADEEYGAFLGWSTESWSSRTVEYVAGDRIKVEPDRNIYLYPVFENND